ncbi:MAG TPA: ATP-binding protein [Kofleriaceae bacterium]
MTRWLRTWSLGARMVGLFTLLLAGIGVFMLAFFPARMAAQARASAEQRAVAIAQVMSTALGPAIEFDDSDNATSILTWLATTPDARFGIAHRAAGTLLAAWHADAVPPGQVWPNHQHLESHGELLIVTVPIVGLGGGAGNLHVGFSLRALADERARTARTVGETTAAVCLVGMVATLMLAAWLVRPIRSLTVTARKISRGELPPELPMPKGSDEVAQMAEALSVMLAKLNEANRQLLTASRHAGMAEIATGVLHNVGNVLTSVNVSVELVHERTRDLPIGRLRRLEELLTAASANDKIDPAAIAAVLRYIALVTGSLEAARGASLRDLDALRGQIDHIKKVVAMQNAYARPGGLAEPVAVDALIREALALGCSGEACRAIAVTAEAPPTGAMIDRHRVLQILVNLISNARDAVLAAPGAPRIAVTATVVADMLRIEVADSGVGIARDALDRIFSAGFTTKPNGHGYGLHSSAIAARQLGGELTVTSDGPGLGAAFTLRIPIAAAGATP